MKTKLLALALALALSLTACGGPREESPANGGDQNITAPDSGGTPEEEVPEEGAAGDSAPDAGDPVENPKEIDLTAFYNTLREENTWPELMSLTKDQTMKELLDSYYPGLAEISTKQRGVYIAAISAAVGEIALVEVENAEDVQAVKDIFQARIDYQVGDDANPGGAWYPETIEGWKNKSRIVSHGNYVMLAVGEPSDSAAESFEALFA